MNENEQLIKKYFDEAPADIQLLITEIIHSPQSITSISEKYNLDPIKTSALQMEMILILLGIEPISAFRTNLVRELKVTYDQAIKISSDINSNFLSSVLEGLKNIEKKDDGDETSSSIKAQEILNSQLGKNLTEKSFIHHQLIERKPTEAKPEAELLIPDHEEMEKEGGTHLHSQTIMPKIGEEGQTAAAAAQTEHSANSTRPSLGNIVDQKLKNIVRSSSENLNNKYKGNDPYREPIE